MITATCLAENGGFIETRVSTSCGGTTVSTETLPTAITSYQLFPNPFDHQLSLQLDLKESTTVNLTLFTINGQVLRKERQALPSGENRVAIATSDLPVGMYLLGIATADGRIMERVVKVN